MVDRFRLFFNRKPDQDPGVPLVGGLSQGRYPIPRSIEDNQWIQSSGCKKCHPVQWNAWKKSFHSKAFTGVRFREAFQREPLEWCLNCHAPYHNSMSRNSGKTPEGPPVQPVKEFYRTDGTLYILERKEENEYHNSIGVETALSPLDTPLNRDGVGCAVCHLKNGIIYTSEPVSPFKKLVASWIGGHTLESDPSSGQKEFCAGCHEFNFPSTYGPVVGYTEHPMQTTVSDFVKTQKKIENLVDRKKSCLQCHFKNGYHGGSAISHGSPGDDFSFEFQTIPCEGDCSVRIQMRIKSKKIGHPFPTGDLFRQLRLSFLSKEGTILLSHNLTKDVDPNTFQIRSDTRIHPDSRGMLDQTFTFDLKETPDHCLVELRFEGKIDKLTGRKVPLEEQGITIYRHSF